MALEAAIPKMNSVQKQIRPLHDPFRRTLPFAIGLALLAVGCARLSCRVQTLVEADSVVVDRMVENQIGLEGEGRFSDFAVPGVSMDVAPVERVCFLNASRHRAPDGTTAYYLSFSYTGPDQLIIEERRTMELEIDGADLITLERHGEVSRTQSDLNASSTESCDYEIAAQVLKLLAHARSVHVLVTGSGAEVNGYFLQSNFENFKRFVDGYVM